MTIGFTGTRKGMNWTQRSVIFKLIKSIKPTLARHGVCKGADEQFDHLCEMASILTEGYPSDIPRWVSKKCNLSKVHKPSSPLNRNKRIVQMVDLVIAAPASTEEELRSGTWATIRYAKSKKVRLWIVFPDGSREMYGPKGGKYVKEKRVS